MTFYMMLWIFLLYSFVGWCVEVAFQAMTRGRFINRGFLNGPVCPIYGFGVLFITLIFTNLESGVFSATALGDNLLLQFLVCTVITTALEFVTGWILETVFHDKWWDYSKEPFNVKGYICLRFSLLWGLACVFVMRNVHSDVVRLVGWLPLRGGYWILGILSALMLTDLVITTIGASKMVKRYRLVRDLREQLRAISDGIGESLAASTLSAKDRYEEGKENIEEYKKAKGDLYSERKNEIRERLTVLIDEKNAIQNRLLKSFPRFGETEYRSAIQRIREYLNSEEDK